MTAPIKGVNSIFVHDASPYALQSELKQGFLAKKSVTKLIDSIPEGTKLADISIIREENGKLSWNVGGNDIDLTQKPSGFSLWVRRIARFFGGGDSDVDNRHLA